MGAKPVSREPTVNEKAIGAGGKKKKKRKNKVKRTIIFYLSDRLRVSINCDQRRTIAAIKRRAACESIKKKKRKEKETCPEGLEREAGKNPVKNK